MKLELLEDQIPSFPILVASVEGSEVARMHPCREDFDGPMSVREHKTIVTSIRIACGIISPPLDNTSAGLKLWLIGTRP